MAWATAVAWLGGQIGPVIAKRAGEYLRSTDNTDKRLEKVLRLIKSGTAVVEAFQEVFGVDFYKAISSSLPSPTAWTYAAGRRHYLPVEVNRNSDKVHALRIELDLNLDRLAQMEIGKEIDRHNYFLGLFQEWRSRYTSLLGEDSDATETFATIESLLDGNKKTFADAFRLLQRTGLGTVGALMLIMAVMLATSTGVGVGTMIATWLIGVPFAKIAALVLPGVLLVALATVNFDFTNGMSASVRAANALLDRRAGTMKGAAVKRNKVTGGAKKVLPKTKQLSRVATRKLPKPVGMRGAPSTRRKRNRTAV